MITLFIQRTLKISLICTLVIGGGLSFLDPVNWTGYFVSTFVFSFCIALPSVLLIHHLFPRLKQLPIVPRTGGLVVLFLIGGSLGTELGTLILHLNFSINGHVRLLLFNLLLAIIIGAVSFLYFTLQDTVKRMAEKLKEKDVQEEKLRRLKTEAELEALQSKVNPHFLFNTLNSIASLISENPAAAESTVEKLAELFRYTLQSTSRRSVRLVEELEIVRLYLQIEKIRFGDRLSFDIRHDARLDDLEIPALLIQPLIENSIKHAIAPEMRGGTLCLETSLADDECRIVVTDSGAGFTIDGGAPGFGLKSITERLHLLYGEKAHLDVSPLGHTHIQITIPLRQDL